MRARSVSLGLGLAFFLAAVCSCEADPVRHCNDPIDARNGRADCDDVSGEQELGSQSFIVCPTE